MSDNLNLAINIRAHDEASPTIKQIRREIERFRNNISKAFASPLGNADFGLERITKAQAAQRAQIDRTAAAAVAAMQRQSATEKRLAGQRGREAASARRSEARDYAESLRALQSRFGFEARMTRQRDAETAQSARRAAASEAEASRALRDRMAFSSRMLRQRVAEERAAARDIAQIERERARETRDNARLDARRNRQHERARHEFTGRARDAGHRVSDAYTRSTRFAAGAGAAGAVGTGALVKRSLGAEVDVDSAEVSTRVYGGLSKDQARDLRDRWAAPLSEQLGVETARLLTAWVDATKLGIPASGAKEFAALTTKTSEAWEVSFDKVKETLGTVNSILTSDGSAFDIKRLSSASNTLQHLAARQSTTPEKLIEFLGQGAGASQILGASQEAGLAFGSASTSLGNRAGESGRLYDYIASRIVEMPRLTQKKGDDGKYSRQLMRDLGYGTAENMDRARRSNPDAFLPDFLDRFSKIKDPKRQEESVRWFTGREWMGEFGRMVKGSDTYREAEKLRQEAKGLDAIGEVWEKHQEKLAFVYKQFRAGWLNVLGEFGKTLSPLARQAGDTFLGWSKELRSGGLAARFKASIQGAIEGLGFRDLPGLLTGIFGKPGEGGAGSVETWKAAAFGFADGIRSVGAAIKGAFSAFAGANASPETIARLTGQIIALAGACVVIAPVVGVIGSIAAALGALALAATSAWRVIGGAGLVGGAAAGAGAAGAGASATAGAAAGGIASRLGIAGAGTAMMSALGLAIVAEIGANRGTISTVILDGIKSFVSGLMDDIKKRLTFKNIASGFVPAPLERWWNGNSAETTPQRDISPEGTKKVIENLNEEIGRLNQILRKSKESISGSSGNDSLQGSAAEDRLTGEVRRLGQSTAAHIRLAALTATGSTGAIAGGGGGFGGSPGAGVGGGATVPGVGGILNARPGERLGPGSLGRRGIIGGAGVTSPMLRGEAERNAKEAYDFFRSKGLSHEAASGILASMHKESGFNPGARGDGGRAHGLFQHHPDRRAAIQRATGIDMSNATVRQQLEGAWWEMNHGDAGAQRALRILRQQGITAREAGGAFVQHFERPKRDERAERGALAEGFAQRYGGGGAAGSGAGASQYDGLRLKGAQATAGGAAHQGVTDLMRAVQGDLPGVVKHFAAVNDKYHQGTRSKHASGLAFDTSLVDPSKSREAAEAIRNRLRAAGLAEAEFKVIDEYRNPSARSTGGHLHTQFNTAEAAAKYARYLDSLKGPAVAAAEATKDAADSVSGAGIAKSAGANRLSDLVHRYDVTKPKALNDPGTLSDLVQRYGPGRNTGENRVDTLPHRPTAEGLAGTMRSTFEERAKVQRSGGGDSKSMTVNAPITIQGSTNPEHVANRAARHIQDSTLWRTHDLDFSSV